MEVKVGILGFIGRIYGKSAKKGEKSAKKLKKTRKNAQKKTRGIEKGEKGLWNKKTEKCENGKPGFFLEIGFERYGGDFTFPKKKKPDFPKKTRIFTVLGELKSAFCTFGKKSPGPPVGIAPRPTLKSGL